MADQFFLRWNNYNNNITAGFHNLLLEGSMVDVTLAAGGRFVQAHRLVLSVCSPYFKNLFSTNTCNHPIVFMKDVRFKQLTDILSFMYQGEVNVQQEELADFLKTAEILQIKGLAEHNAQKDFVPATLSEVLSRAPHPDQPRPCSSGGSSHPQKELQRGSGHMVHIAADVQLPLSGGSSTSKAPASTVSTGTQTLENVSPAATLPRGTLPLEREEVISALPANVLVKEEVIDTPIEAEYQMESCENLPSDIPMDETILNDTPIFIQGADSEEPLVTEKSLLAAPSSQNDAQKTPPKNLLNNEKEKSSSSSSGSSGRSNAEQHKFPRHRKQRSIALNKIRRFLVAPKRSRRIAYAHKMKGKKRLLKSSVVEANVTDVSKQFSDVSRNTTLSQNVSEVDNPNQDPVCAEEKMDASTTTLTACEDNVLKKEDEKSPKENENNVVKQSKSIPRNRHSNPEKRVNVTTTANLRSSAPQLNGSVKENSMSVSCRHSGCVGCRGGN